MRISLALLLIAACSLSSGDDGPPVGDDTPPGDDAPPACTTPNPGCDDDELCPGDCGDKRYRCVDGAWVMSVYCEQCLGLPYALYPATWRFTQTLDPAPGCDLALRAEVVLAVAEQTTGDFLSLTPEDPDLEILYNVGGLDWTNQQCWETVQVGVNDVVQLDGVDTPAAITWNLDFWRTGLDTIVGDFTGVVEGCTFSGTIAGTHDAPPPS